ncbi:sugar kinase [bacterium]|nr:MAG: sugar kinase [bacterium]
MFPSPDKVVFVTKKTPLEELVERHNSREQARFYVEARGATFARYEAEHDAYQQALETLKKALSALPNGMRTQWIEREFLPQFSFGARDLVVALGPDGLVVNIAKYLHNQVLVAFNPDPARNDGILLPFAVWLAEPVLRQATRGQGTVSELTMAQCALNDGQSILALNDLFLGRRGHASARYELKLEGKKENQSSSGIIVSTGAGSTGWLSSIVTGAARVMEANAPDEEIEFSAQNARFGWSEQRLQYAVREPFKSKTSGDEMVWGRIEAGQQLEVTSQIPQDGAIFSDGIESDYLEWNIGSIARVSIAERKLHLLTAT